ncbi:MAG: hypothetical protein IPO19_14810 [Rhodoferax sp.]|nr:hypothetical protein [Rhodoferax sp.]
MLGNVASPVAVMAAIPVKIATAPVQCSYGGQSLAYAGKGRCGAGTLALLAQRSVLGRRTLAWHGAWVEGRVMRHFRRSRRLETTATPGLSNDMQSWLPVVDGASWRGWVLVSMPLCRRHRPTLTMPIMADTGRVPLSAQSKANGYARFLQA